MHSCFHKAGPIAKPPSYEAAHDLSRPVARAAIATVAMLIAGWALPAAATCEKAKVVRFAPGASSAELTGGIPRGDSDCYAIGAKAGQRLIITQTPTIENNIVFQLYSPPWKISPDGEIKGRTLPGAGEGEDTRKWSGTLPVSGDTLMVVGTTRGGGGYRIRVEIR